MQNKQVSFGTQEKGTHASLLYRQGVISLIVEVKNTECAASSKKAMGRDICAEKNKSRLFAIKGLLDINFQRASITFILFSIQIGASRVPRSAHSLLASSLLASFWVMGTSVTRFLESSRSKQIFVYLCSAANICVLMLGGYNIIPPLVGNPHVR
mmetsp:Transcript_30552/g.69913  ORF Transcript_30552/g.69913 Transcript_30552/m.69913 type:complete len:155 (-) Transcript_30552:325-789(-)